MPAKVLEFCDRIDIGDEVSYVCDNPGLGFIPRLGHSGSELLTFICLSLHLQRGNLTVIAVNLALVYLEKSVSCLAISPIRHYF
jgi:hypothetical protein